MVPTENKNNAYAKFGGTNKEYYSIFRNGQIFTLPYTIVKIGYNIIILQRVKNVYMLLAEMAH